MNRKVQFFFALSLYSVVVCPSSDRPLTFAESIFVGGTAGVAEVTLPGQPLVVKMNMDIRNAAIKDPAIPKEKFSFLQSYRGKGFGAHAGGQMPILAIQKVVKEKGSQFLEAFQGKSLSDGQKAGVSFAAGVAGAMIDTPANAIQLYLQNKANAGKSIMQACKELGMKKAFRGFTPNAFLKEGPFVVGYQFLSSKGEEIAQEFVENKFIAKLLGGISAGVFTAVVTQPGAVLRNTMQGDARYAVTSTLQTAQRIYSQEGYKSLFTGLSARGVRVAIAIPLLNVYSTALEKFIK